MWERFKIGNLCIADVFILTVVVFVFSLLGKLFKKKMLLGNIWTLLKYSRQSNGLLDIGSRLLLTHFELKQDRSKKKDS